MAGKVNPTFDTPLNRIQEKAFQDWRAAQVASGGIHPLDLGTDYDMRGAYLAGFKPGADGHWPDVYKKPNHETFSDESIYSSLVGTKPGTWTGPNRDIYKPFDEQPKQNPLQGFNAPAHQEQMLNSGPFLQAKQLAQHWLGAAKSAVTDTVKNMKPGYNLDENKQLDALKE